MRARPRNLGVSFVSKPVAGEARTTDIAVCLDPDGTKIELIQVQPEHWRVYTIVSDFQSLF